MKKIAEIIILRKVGEIEIRASALATSYVLESRARSIAAALAISWRNFCCLQFQNIPHHTFPRNISVETLSPHRSDQCTVLESHTCLCSIVVAIKKCSRWTATTSCLPPNSQQIRKSPKNTKMRSSKSGSLRFSASWPDTAPGSSQF